MLIGISGTQCSGKTEVARYLTFQGFKFITYSKHTQSKITPDLAFDDITQLINYVTNNWLENFVFIGIDSLEHLELFSKRPFFLHISIDSPILLRFKRYNQGDLLQFIEKFDSNFDIIKINSSSSLSIINTFSTVQDLYVKLSELNLTDQQRLRPSWDSYFMRLADLAALRSNCMKRRVGCVIVKDNRVVATGYNGTPRNLKNCNQGGCSRCNNSLNSSGLNLSTCLCLHAEENALLESGRERISGNTILYCNTCPCLTCTIKIVQTGIKEVVYSQSYSMDELSSKVFKEAGVTLRQFIPPKDGVVSL